MEVYMTRLAKSRLLLAVLALLALSPLFPISMNPRVRSVPRELQEQVFVTPEETLPGLTAALVAGVGDTATKVRILHDWICDNIAYDCDVFSEQGAGPQNHAAVLQKRKAVCSGYSNLMYVMCYYAGVEADVVSGWSKGFNYPGYLRDRSDHAWNVIKIGSRWQQVDVTWDAGHVEGTTFIKRYSTQWLNRKPEEFIYSHLPEEEQWQLLKEPRSPEQFVKEPYIEGTFFDYGFSLGTGSPAYTNDIDGAAAFCIYRSGGSPVRCDLYEADSGRDVPHSVWCDSYGNRMEALADVPDGKTYCLRWFAQQKDASRPPKFFAASEFERRLLPKARELLKANKITQKEFDFLEASFWKVEENGRYYPVEDLFDTARNTATMKILRLAEMAGSGYERVLEVEVRAAEGYGGYGQGLARFPVMYAPFNAA
ncbi:MAG: hypothetical protein II932_04230, partial [Treponema sp.]|nr:hypothetical protein [Treponema sp.]